MADEVGALLIADEMITGLGRTGKRWGIDHTGVRPDVVTIGKAFGGGFPLSGLLTTDEIAQARAVGQPVGIVVELRRQPAGRRRRRRRAADHRRGEAGRQRARRGRGAEARAASRSSIAIRSSASSTARACSSAIELVKDKKTKEPLPRKVTERIFTEAVRRGLLTMAYAASFRIQPALTIDEATAKNGVAILREVFDLVERERIWQRMTGAGRAAPPPLSGWRDRLAHVDRGLVRLRPRAVRARPRRARSAPSRSICWCARTARSRSRRRRWS